MAKLLVGTCSWTDPTLLASGWYPREANTAEKRLQHYATNFPIVEVDSTYYGMPAEKTARLWVERTPPHFTFNVKAFSLLTNHPTQLRALPKDLRVLIPPTAKASVYYRDIPEEVRAEIWQRFEAALLPLDSAGKLGVVLLQFPEWFLPGRDSLRHIEEAPKRLPQYRLAIEFRNGTWVSEGRKDETFRFLRENRFIYVSVDEPQGFRSSVPPVVEATSDIAVVRFHGRNRETWEKKGISVAERFNYLYAQDELREWLPSLSGLASQVKELHVMFNNCYRDCSVRNARDMDVLMKSQPSLFPDYQRPPNKEWATGPAPGLFDEAG
jgi:uncharacterized protein YecE (DUF72 family)